MIIALLLNFSTFYRILFQLKKISIYHFTAVLNIQTWNTADLAVSHRLGLIRKNCTA